MRTIKLSSPMDTVALVLATGLGVGFAPVGPGTAGSLLGLLIAWLIVDRLKFSPDVLWMAIACASAIVLVIGIWAASRAEKIFGRKDAGEIVIDEVCGQIITFAFLGPLMGRIGGGWRWSLVAGFLLFRLFDITKPFPIGRLENFGSGIGVMADDVGAGLFAAVALWILLSLLY